MSSRGAGVHRRVSGPRAWAGALNRRGRPAGHPLPARPPAARRPGRLSTVGRLRLVGGVLLLAGVLIHGGEGSTPGVYRDVVVSVTGCSVSPPPAKAEVLYTVTNQGVAPHVAVLHIEYRDAASRIVATDVGRTAAIKPGRSVVSATVTSLRGSPRPINCRIRATVR